MTRKIPSLLENLYSDELKWKITLLENWHSIMGSMGTRIVLLSINESTLVLGVIHPAWAQELHLMKTTIQHNINTFLGKEYIKNIQFQVAKPLRKTPQPLSSGPRRPVIQHRSLTSREESVLEKVSDDGLKNALRRYLAFCAVSDNTKK